MTMNFFTQGFVLQAGLILSLGAQNLFLIDIGLKRNHYILAATICGLCDVLLILLGVLGVSSLLVSSPSFKLIIGITGSIFLLCYGALKLKDAFFGTKISNLKNKEFLSKKLVVLATLSFTLLNPHVYIDTFFLIGGYSTQFKLLSNKLMFGLGAGCFSVIWFYFLVIFSSRFSHILRQEKCLRALSLLTGILLIYLSLKLGVGVIL